MAKRRMFSLDIVDTDAFLEMPCSTQALYFHLGMRADDDGFVASPKRITSTVNASIDDFKLLVAKGFIIPFNSGVCAIKDWRVNNYVRGDRYTPTRYLTEKASLADNNGSYALQSAGMTLGIPDVNQVVTKRDTQDRLGKDSKEKNIYADKPQTKTKFSKPSVDEIAAYCRERANSIDPQAFIDHYESNGWKVGCNAMKDWRAAVRTWERNDKGSRAPKAQNIQAGYSTSDLVEYPEGSGQYVQRDAIHRG